MTAPNRNETFGRLLKAAISSIANCEGKTAPIIEDELGAQIGIAGKSIQRYKTGHLPPDPRTVQILAEAGVQRGFMNRDWLQNFLHAARYPFAEKLLDQLCPAPATRPRPPRVYENLPAPTYSQFVMRPQAFAEVLDGLGQRSAAVLIVGLGGNGKTSLAREMAARCLRNDAEAPRFDAVVWVSDKDRPGTTNLSTVLDTIARTLDYPGFTQFAHEEKRDEVEQLLRRQKTLLVIDNFETIADGALLTWLLRLPEPSKALITTREYRREWRSSWPVELRGMSEAEAWELISERARALKVERLVGDRTQLEPLLAATGGNPKALTMTMGLLKYERRPLQLIVDDLYAARGDLFHDLFARAWALLDEAARRVLLVATFFPSSANGAALSATADVPGFAFDRAVERLADLALLDVQQEHLNSVPRYMLHPLVRAFAAAHLAEQPGFEAGARERWAADLEARAHQAMALHPYADLALLEESDLAARAFLEWADRTARWTSFLAVYHRISSLWSIRGLFDVREHFTGRAIAAARAAGQIEQMVRLLASLARLKSYLGDQAAAERCLAEALELRAHLPGGPTKPSTDLTLAITRAVLALYTGQPAAALANLMQYPAQMHDPWIRNQHGYWIGRCLTQLDRNSEAREVLEQVLEQAEQMGRARLAGNSANLLVSNCITLGDLDGAARYQLRSSAIAQLVNDQRHIAELRRVTGRLCALGGDLPAARAALAEAIDRFERLGMRRELAEARAELDRLETGAAPLNGAAFRQNGSPPA